MIASLHMAGMSNRWLFLWGWVYQLHPNTLRTVPSCMTWLVTLKAPPCSGTWCGPVLSLTTVRWLSTMSSMPLMLRSVVHQWRRTLISRCYYILLVAKLFLYLADDFPELLHAWTNLLHSFNSGGATVVTVRGLQFCFLVTLEFHGKIVRIVQRGWFSLSDLHRQFFVAKSVNECPRCYDLAVSSGGSRICQNH